MRPQEKQTTQSQVLTTKSPTGWLKCTLLDFAYACLAGGFFGSVNVY